MYEPVVLIIIICTFFLAGTVKGVVGLGLPTVSLGLLTVALDLPTAMALLLLPSFVTNLWQAIAGGNGTEILRRIWPFLLMATATVWIGAIALTRIDLWLLSALLGGLLITYALISLVGIRLNISRQQEVWAGPLIGTVNGVLTGMTGSFAVPGVMFLQAIGLPRDMLIQAMGMLFTVSTLALAAALKFNNLLTVEHGILSAAALVPAMIGMVLGQVIRRRLPERIFQKTFFVALLLLGAYIIANASLF
ncbi:MAG: sulfite exporter TauE/SafE family protein [Gammaproteobacteria bacterium]|nr:sulfite exporter TauE/SafE family protein [Gammaproteobacteria bacterium]